MLLPAERTGRRGHPVKDNRTMINGMVWIVRSGAAWRDLPERYGPWESVYSRFRKWTEDSILDNVFRVLTLDADEENLSIDSTIIRAHQASAGAKRGATIPKSPEAVAGWAPRSMRR